jgi:hypothetical protein
MKKTAIPQDPSSTKIPSPARFHDDWRAYIDWATVEYVEGRSWGPLKVSSARQVVGSTQRFLQWLKNEGPLPPCDIFTISQGSKKTTSLEESWIEVLTPKNVKAFVQHLDGLQRTPNYIAGQVILRRCSIRYACHATRCPISPHLAESSTSPHACTRNLQWWKA